MASLRCLALTPLSGARVGFGAFRTRYLREVTHSTATVPFGDDAAKHRTFDIMGEA